MPGVNPRQATSVGLVSSCKPEEWVKAWKIDDWNTARVLVEGKYPKVTTWINGLQVCVWDGATSNSKAYDKEAVLKALGTGWTRGIQWQDIEVRNDLGGKPSIALGGGARELCLQQGISQVMITISHCRSFATAYALAVGKE